MTRLFILLALIAALAGAAYATEYLWFTNDEVTVFGDRIKFWYGDTLDGPIRTNSMFAIGQDPVFLDLVISSASDFWHGSGFNPTFFGPLPIFNADPLAFPVTADNLRNGAMAQGWYFDNPGMSYRATFMGTALILTWWPTGTLYDSTRYLVVPINYHMCIFVDAPLDIQGVMQGQVTIGCSGTMRILDDLRYVDASPIDGRVPDGNGDGIPDGTNMLGLVSEGDIKVANTPANGRCNSNGLGVNQTNPAYSSIVITAAVHALGESFTFEQQNDPDSGYVYPNGPDDRGTIYIFGSLMQARRGYVHRSTLGSTGYRLKLHYDKRLQRTLPPCFSNVDAPYTLSDDTLNFGNVATDSVAWDTLTVDLQYTGFFAGTYATWPFQPVAPPQATGEHFAIPVRFSPMYAIPYSGTLSLTVGSHFIQIPLRGRGVAPGAPLVMALAPNPCNLSTMLRYTLPAAGQVKLTLYDVLGRVAKQVDVEIQAAGEHTLNLDLTGLASGVYFTQIEAANQRVTQKLLLVK